MELGYKSVSQSFPYKTLPQILAAKPSGVYSVTPTTSVFSALQLMAEKEVGALVVLEGQKLEGIFSERDYARRVVLTGKTSKDTLIREVMTGNPVFVTPDHTVPQCMELMTNHRTRHLPVVDNDHVIGVLSIGDLVKEVVSHHERVMRELEQERMTILLPDPSSY